MMRLWLRNEEESLLKENCEISLDEYSKDILTGVLDNNGKLGGLRKTFTLGKERVFKPKCTTQKQHYVRIDNNSMYPHGVILTPYSDIEVIFHLNSRLINDRTRLERIELMGSDEKDFVQRVFGTYYGIVKRNNERDNHFLMYSTHME